MRKGKVLQEAELDPNAVKYQLVSALIMVCCTVVFIPLLPFILLWVFYYYTRYYESLRIVLTTRELIVHRGIWIREEKTIPLEKVTDLALGDGPIMRKFGLKSMRVETAGQTGGMEGLVKVIGIVNCPDFRDLALLQRDRISDQDDTVSKKASRSSSDASEAQTLTDIRDTLHRIEKLLQQQKTG
ncbi:MAG: PH domain-containing protein [Phycisphaerales bacterium]|nr:MAG: PH domain-containing protein [Phycisphaerales bacterium]